MDDWAVKLYKTVAIPSLSFATARAACNDWTIWRIELKRIPSFIVVSLTLGRETGNLKLRHVLGDSADRIWKTEEITGPEVFSS